jgi:peptide/nickel transport system substrate-binding protein
MKKTILYSTFMLLIVAAMVLTACSPALTQAPETMAPTVGSVTIPTSTSEAISPTTEAISPTTESTAGNIPQGGTINYVNMEPALLNPYLRPEQIAWQAIALISTGLVDLNSIGEWVLELASEFPSVDNGTLSADGTTVTWKLRTGLKWSDGTPLTTDDLVFTWEVCSNPQSGCAINAGFNKITNIETPDELTAIVHYDGVYPAWMAQFRNGILPRHGTGAPENMLTWDWNRTVNPTDGPYIVKEWVAADHITFVRNPYYWEEGKPYLDQINWLIVPDLEVERQMLMGGEADLDVYVAGEPQVLETAKAGFTIGGGPTPFFNRIQFNLKDPQNLDQPHPLLGDVRVRQAFLMAINREDATYNWNVSGLYKANLITSLYDLWPQFACNIPAFSYDPEGAKALLDEAGWKDLNGDGVRECNGCQYAKEGTPLRLRVSTYSNWGQEDNELVMVDELKKVGIDLYLQNYEATVMYSSWSDGSFMYRGDFDVLWWDHDPGMPDPQFRTDTFYTSAYIPIETNPTGMNMSRINDPEIDQWAKEAGSTVDVSTRQELYCKIANKIDKVIVSEQANGVLSNFAFSNPKLKGWSVNELYSPFGWDAEDWYLEP